MKKINCWVTTHNLLCDRKLSTSVPLSSSLLYSLGMPKQVIISSHWLDKTGLLRSTGSHISTDQVLLSLEVINALRWHGSSLGLGVLVPDLLSMASEAPGSQRMAPAIHSRWLCVCAVTNVSVKTASFYGPKALTALMGPRRWHFYLYHAY